VVIIGEKGQV